MLRNRIIQVRIERMIEAMNMIEITWTQDATPGQSSGKENFKKEQSKLEDLI